MLANLELIAARRGDLAMQVWVLGLRSGLPGAGAEEQRRVAAARRAMQAKLN
jgi:hypothetical protein